MTGTADGELSLPVVGEGVVVDRLVRHDAAALSVSHSDPGNARFQGWRSPLSVEEAGAFIAEQEGEPVLSVGSAVQLAVRAVAGGPLVGDLYLARSADDPSEAELGITLVPGHHGRGLATATIGAVVAALRRGSPVGLARVVGWADVDNERSLALLRRCGFVPDGAPPSPTTRRHGTPSHELRLVLDL